MMNINQAAKMALDIQDACNLSGVVTSFAQAMEVICKSERNTGTDWKNNHPIARMFASKIHDLSGMGLSDSHAFVEAYDLCKRLADGDEKAY